MHSLVINVINEKRQNSHIMFEVVSELSLAFFIAVIIIQLFPELSVEELDFIRLVLIEAICC
jgi:hypothetical protein